MLEKYQYYNHFDIVSFLLMINTLSMIKHLNALMS